MKIKHSIGSILLYIVTLAQCSSMDIYKNTHLNSRIVQTRYGRLQGIILPLDNYKFLKPIEAFLGVPYATPPIKSNRFSPTRTPSPWDGVRLSDKYSAVCPQRLPNIQNETAALEKMPKGRLEYLKRLLPFLQNQSEDCLYLNVFSPVYAATAEKKLPVIMFIHGESFEWNSGNPYDGSVLASYGELVVVTLNYRLGVLGFLNANPSPQIRARVANYGLMDQMAALHWVQQNIAKFGGDPGAVTLAGHGSGAACINFLMTSPTMVPGLFHRAILLSGSAYASWAVVEDPVVYALKLAKELNCTVPSDLIKNHEQIVDCLREIPLEDLLSVNIQAPSYLSAFGPSVDGVVIRTGLSNQDPDELLSAGTSKRSHDSHRRYDLLFGVVTSEALWRFSNIDILNGFEGERRDRIIRTYVRNAYTFHLSEIFYTVVNEYTDWERTSQHPINTRDAAVAALSDAQFVAPLVHTGDTLAPTPALPGQEKSGPNCFFYVFDYQTKEGDYPQRMGTVHGEDLPYVFGAPLVDGFSHFPHNYTKAEVALSESLILFWSNFARTGNPNEHQRPDSVLAATKERNRFRGIVWDEYDPVHQKYLEIGMKPRMKNHFRAHQLSIWLRLIPELHRAGMEDVIGRHNLFKNHDNMDLYEGVVKPDSLSRLSLFEESYKRRSGNSNDTLTLGGITTMEPLSLTTCMPVANYSALSPTSAINATTDTLNSLEAAGYAAYSTALSVTIAIGCSLLILNVLIFAGVYYQRDKTRLEVKSLQKQYQQRGMPHQQPPFDPIKHAHYHLGHSQPSNVIVDVENHDSGTILLSNDIKSPHICSNSMQINTTGGCLQTKIPLSDSAPFKNTRNEHVPMKNTLNRTATNPPTGFTGSGMMTLPKPGSGGMQQTSQMSVYRGDACLTLPRKTNTASLSISNAGNNETHLNKIQPNGSAVRAPRPPIRNGSSVSNSSSPPENTPLLSGLNHQHQQYHLQQQQKGPPGQQQVPQAAISEMRV
ncbi:neuroligin-4, Y-linked-like isoform X1 [Lutzomyia longipalpis]|nr:neuroligin-4, Y-linked-like isoform X1 [Lutzomyia longipalpis]XP_055695141.1 neuroligin-4, Y-linked-like isoform X1 [Lutzomyia longipalpis]XP_055695142.1 neuroligin-4, Y-linked-like isoform X1 [Lutzomyia longipalpis]